MGAALGWIVCGWLGAYRSDLHYTNSKAPEFTDLNSIENRRAVKKTLKGLLAGIVIYSNEKTAWLLSKSGTVTGIMYEEDGRRSATEEKLIQFHKDIMESVKSGNIDPQLLKVANSVIQNDTLHRE